LGDLQLYKVYTTLRRNRSARSEVETGRRGIWSGSKKTDSLISLEFLFQEVDVG